MFKYSFLGSCSSLRPCFVVLLLHLGEVPVYDPSDLLRLEQASPAEGALGPVPVDLGTGLGFLSALELLQESDGVLRGEVFVKPLVVHLQHGRVHAGAEALHFREGEEPVL